MREREVVVAVAIGSVCAPISVVLLYPFGLVSLWPYPVLMLAAGWLLARRGLTLPSRILGTVGLAAVSLIGSAALIEGVLYQLEAGS